MKFLLSLLLAIPSLANALGSENPLLSGQTVTPAAIACSPSVNTVVVDDPVLTIDCTSNSITAGSPSTVTFLGNAFSVGVATFVVSSGKIGVGDATPNASFSMTLGDGSFASDQGILLDAPTNKATVLSFFAANTREWDLYSPASSTDLRLYDSADRVTFQAGGDVGIGNTDPQSVLHIGKNGSNQNLLISSGSAPSTDAYLRILYMGGGFVSLNGSDSRNVFVTDDKKTAPILFSAEGFQFSSDQNTSVTTMTIVNKRVGIGLPNPAASLDVAGLIQEWVRTKAQIDAITPTAGGQTVICSDCTVPFDTCVSTGSTLSGFRAVINSAINTAVPGTLVPKGCGSGN